MRKEDSQQTAIFFLNMTPIQSGNQKQPRPSPLLHPSIIRRQGHVTPASVRRPLARQRHYLKDNTHNRLLIVCRIYVGTQTRKLPIPVRGSALPVLVPILELTSVHFLIRIFPKYDRIHQYRQRIFAIVGNGSCQYWYGHLARTHTGKERHSNNDNTVTGTWR